MTVRRIVVDPQIHFGQPILEGTRIPVWCVLELVQVGIPFAQIVERYYPALDGRGCPSLRALCHGAGQVGRGPSHPHLMRFLSDQDVWQATVDFIRAAGYEVQRAADVGLAQASDVQLLEYARREGRVLLTRDKGFGSLVFVKQREHRGVILLRVTPETLEAVEVATLR